MTSSTVGASKIVEECYNKGAFKYLIKHVWVLPKYLKNVTHIVFLFKYGAFKYLIKHVWALLKYLKNVTHIVFLFKYLIKLYYLTKHV